MACSGSVRSGDNAQETKGLSNEALEIDCETKIAAENTNPKLPPSSSCVPQLKQSIVRKTESLLSGITKSIQHGDVRSAAVSLCQAYALAPKRTRKQLRRIERSSVKNLIEVLETFCSRYGNQDPPIPITKICELILSPELDPNNVVAWRCTLRMHVDLEHYEEIVLNSDRLRRIPKTNEAAEILLMSSLAHIIFGEEDTGLEQYLEAFHVNAEKANECLRGFAAEKREAICDAFSAKASHLYKNMMSLSAKDNVDMLNYYCEVLRLRPNDMKSAEIYGRLLMKVFRYEDAKVVFSRCIENLESAGDLLEGIRFRLYHAECLVNLGGFDEAVMDYLEAMEHDSCLTQVTLHALSNAHVTKLTACIIEQATALVNDISGGDGQDSGAVTADNALQLYRKLYKLLYAIDSENVDALRKCAECLQVAGKHEDAVALLTEAIRKTPSVHLLCERALSYLGMRNFEKAQTDLECASHLQANSVELYCCQSYLYFLIKKPVKAIQDISHACSVSSTSTVKILRKFTPEQHGTIVGGIEKYIRQWMKKAKKVIQSKSKVLLSLCDLLVNFSPRNIQYYLQYSDLLVALEMSDEAQSIMLRMVKSSPNDCLPIIHLAALRLNLGKTDLAMEGFCSVLRELDEECLAAEFSEFPKKERAHISRQAHARGLTLSGEEKFLEAIDCFGVAIAAASCSAPDSYLARARCLAHLQHYMKAISDFTAVLKRTPSSVDARCGRACVYVRLQEHLAATRDILSSLQTNIPATNRFLGALPEQKLRMVLFAVEKYLQVAFAFCGNNGDIASPIHQDSTITCGETLLLLSNLLVGLSPKNPKYMSIRGDALIVHKQFTEAIKSLKAAQELSPLDVSITARIALLYTKVDETEAAMHELRKLADEFDTLAFCVQAMDVSAKRLLAQVAFQEAERLKKQDQNAEALKFYSIAVAASGCRDAEILRARGKCYETLQEYTLAIRDFSAVLTIPAPLVSDYCARAVAYMMDENEEKSCRDFISALERDQKVAKDFIASRPGNVTAVRIFATSARIALAHKEYAKAHNVCERGLQLDPDDEELQNVMEKCENNMQKCVLQ